MSKFLIKNATIVNENKLQVADVLIQDDIIQKIDATISDATATVIDASGKYL